MSNVLITGATSGIGEALVSAYAVRGASVIACGRNPDKLTKLSSEHKNITTLAFDITDERQIEKAANNVSSLDTLILNAGDCLYIDDVMHFDAEKFKHVLSVNLLSLGDLLRAFLPKLASGGRIVFISSLATVLPFTRNQAYGTSKAGINYLAQSLAVDLADTSIGVTLVQPGFVKTPLTAKNDFDMPFLMTSEQAALRIVEGVDKGKSHIVFPRRLFWILRLLSWLPQTWVQPLLRKG